MQFLIKSPFRPGIGNLWSAGHIVVLLIFFSWGSTAQTVQLDLAACNPWIPRLDPKSMYNTGSTIFGLMAFSHPAMYDPEPASHSSKSASKTAEMNGQKEYFHVLQDPVPLGDIVSLKNAPRARAYSSGCQLGKWSRFFRKPS